MPLKLVTGPANAAKARVLLDDYRAQAPNAPILVVPTFADVDHYRRELAAGGVVFGASVMRFGWLIREIAQRAGVAGSPLGRVARERLAAGAIATVPLRTLGASAETPGFVGAFLRLVDELESKRIGVGRWRAALRAWAEAGTGARSDYADDLGALYAGYRDRLAKLELLDAPLYALNAIDALAAEPRRWGRTPVLLYGFDDFTALQLRAIETLAQECEADVTVSLPWEAGREAFSGRAETYEALKAAAGADCELALGARAEHYAPASRAALHQLERNLFGNAEGSPPGSVPAGEAILLLEGGGERAELELVGAHVARLLQAGVPAGEIAIVLREPAKHAALVTEVLGAYRIPHTIDRRIPAGHTALGRGLLALARCALAPGEATADDLLTWLRTPGFLQIPALADELEGRLRRSGIPDAAGARALWEEQRFALSEVDELAAAAKRGGAELCTRLAREAGRLFARPFRGQARVLAGPEGDDARAAGALRDALTELAALVSTDRGLMPSPSELMRVLAELELFSGSRPGAEAVTVADPLNIRARRVRALFVCGLQEGVFPKPGVPEPFLGDDERRAINSAAGLGLSLREDRLGRERSLFYAAVSRPTELLALSWRTASDDGDPAVRSLFVDDVLDLFEPDLAGRVETRELGAAGWNPETAPTAREAQLALTAAAPAAAAAIAPLAAERVLNRLRDREAWSASALEAWVSCPVRWFVERLLAPRELVPEPEAMVRGELAHRVLEEALRALQSDGGGPLTPDRLDAATTHALAALRRLAPDYPISTNPERRRAALRRLEADILRYLEHAANAGSRFAPAEFELRFGGGDDEPAAVAIGGSGLRLRGRVDRVDIGPGGEAIVYDYKGKYATQQANWEKEGRLQLALYMLAVEKLLERDVVGGLYQPLGAKNVRARGLLRADADPDLDCVKNDRVDDEGFERVLATALETAERAVAELRTGALEPRPQTCGWKGAGCRYPSICRCDTT